MMRRENWHTEKFTLHPVICKRFYFCFERYVHCVTSKCGGMFHPWLIAGIAQTLAVECLPMTWPQVPVCQGIGQGPRVLAWLHHAFDCGQGVALQLEVLTNCADQNPSRNALSLTPHIPALRAVKACRNERPSNFVPSVVVCNNFKVHGCTSNAGIEEGALVCAHMDSLKLNHVLC